MIRLIAVDALLVGIPGAAQDRDYRLTAVAGGWIDTGYYETVLKESQPSGPHGWRIAVEAVNSIAYFTEVGGSVVCIDSEWPDPG